MGSSIRLRSMPAVCLCFVTSRGRVWILTVRRRIHKRRLLACAGRRAWACFEDQRAAMKYSTWACREGASTARATTAATRHNLLSAGARAVILLFSYGFLEFFLAAPPPPH